MVTVDFEPAGLTLRLRRAEQRVRDALGPVLTTEQVTFEQWQVLASLLERPGQTMTSLAASAALPAATLTRHVDHLVQRALVIRRVDPHDKRRAVAALSVLGERLARRLADLESRVELPVDTDLSAPNLGG